MADISVSLPDEGPSQLLSTRTDASLSTKSDNRPDAETTPSPTSAASQPEKLTGTPPLPSNDEGQSMSNPIVPNPPPPRPYGTRSRKRTGAARPNYAEDRETDIDDEYTGPSKHRGSLSTINVTKAHFTERDKALGITTRRTPGTTNGNTGPMNGTTASTSHKDHIPGMSTFSANPNITIPPHSTSKKRKAPGSAPISTSQQVGNSVSSGGQTLSRRASAGLNISAGARETNLLSFENCHGYLKNGKLKADDGTTLGVNGTCGFNEPDSSHLPFLCPGTF